MLEEVDQEEGALGRMRSKRCGILRDVRGACEPQFIYQSTDTYCTAVHGRDEAVLVLALVAVVVVVWDGGRWL